MTESQASEHVLLHYTTTGEARDRWDPVAAPGLLALLEEARARYVEWGLPAPLDDGDGRIDVHVFDCGRLVSESRSFALPDGPPPASGWLCLTPVEATGARTAAAHELMHLVQFASGGATSGPWAEAFAVWAERRLRPLEVVVSPLVPLDCGFTGGPASCAADRGGYLRWSFLTELAARRGLPFLREVAGRLFRTPPPADPVTEIEAALSAQGGTLPGALADYAASVAAGDSPDLNLRAGPGAATELRLGAAGGTLAVGPTVVDHLSVRYAVLAGGGAPPTCVSGTASVSVAVPSGTTTVVPVGVLPSRGAATRLPVTAGRATGSVPMTSCERLVLAFPNLSRAVDGAPFSATLGWRPEAAVRLTQVRLTPPVLRAARRGPALGGVRPRGRGATLRLTADRAGRLRVRLHRLRGTRRGPPLLDASRALRRGSSRISFSGRAGGRALPPGRYVLELTPSGPNLRAGRPVALRLRIRR